MTDPNANVEKAASAIASEYDDGDVLDTHELASLLGENPSKNGFLNAYVELNQQLIEKHQISVVSDTAKGGYVVTYKPVNA